jgi:hypothetical protein
VPGGILACGYGGGELEQFVHTLGQAFRVQFDAAFPALLL